MSRCKVCWRAKCRWVEVRNIAKAPTERLEKVLRHNLSYINYAFSANNGGNGSAHAEERAYERLAPITAEIEKRKHNATAGRAGEGE